MTNEHTWPIYTGAYTVSHDKYGGHDNEIRVIRGKDCTYVTRVFRVFWDWHWFHFMSNTKLVDPKTDTQYVLRSVEHFPLDTYMWIHGQKGDMVRFTLVFPPLPEDVKEVDYVSGYINDGLRLSNMSSRRNHTRLQIHDAAQEVIY